MGLFNFFRRVDEPEELVEVNVSFSELKQKLKSSLIKVNKIDDSVAEPLIESLFRVKMAFNDLKNAEINGSDALSISALSQRKQLLTLLSKSFKKPSSLVSLNNFISESRAFAKHSLELINQFKELRVVIPDLINKLVDSLSIVLDSCDELSEAIIERNKQLNSFKELVNAVKSLNEVINELRKLEDEELEVRKRISGFERDKAFMASEMARIKEIEFFTSLIRAENSLKNIESQKNELRSNASKLFNKFSKALRRVFDNDEFVSNLLTNTLDFIVSDEGLFNKRMNLFVKKVKSDKSLSDKEKQELIKAVSDDLINELISEYKKLLSMEESIKGLDFSLLNKYKAFERHLIEINQQVNNELKYLNSFSKKKSDVNERIKALKAKVESIASDCYEEKVLITDLS